MDPPITARHVSSLDVTHPSLSPGSNTQRSATGKRKKFKGKPNIKKLQAIEEKMQSLMVNLKPIPFNPGKIPDFSKHEKLLKKLGLWDFVHIDLDRDIRVDLVAQLIASYEPKNRASKVHDYRINVSRADFARAFKLPVKKKSNNNAGGVVDVDLECEALSDHSIGFVRMLVDDWVILHEDDDTWMIPNEVATWHKMIKDGHPEKVDWGVLFWFMVEKELKQGGQLKDCYYASHLQYLIKFQRRDFILYVEHDSNDKNKKLRINNTWVHNNNNEQLDFGMCLEQMQKKDEEIYRLQHELYLMESVLEGYRKALKETQRAFSEYKEKTRVEDEADA